jgi:peptidoglycan/xylan/chitin deacetylase (PgdA/CDA1 family)
MPPDEFRGQMETLKEWGYTSIPISLLVRAIASGASLPPRPVVITFDDGYDSVYNNAYPVMKELGFTGVTYLIVGALDSPEYMSSEQVAELIENDWEIGSHSMTHPHLPSVPDQVSYEGGYSKSRLEQDYGVEVTTFAYPYGEIDPFVVDKIAEYAYLAAVGLGIQYTHGLDSLYYLSRIEIKTGIGLSAFASMLPWSGVP